MRDDLPKRWAFKHGAYYYRPREREKPLFDGKSWYRLGATYAESLRHYADLIDVDYGDTVAGLVDRYNVEVLPRLRLNTQRSYSQALTRISDILGHNPARAITPQIVYKCMDAIRANNTMNVANMFLKVLNVLIDRGVRWGVVNKNQIKGNVSYFGIKDGLLKARERYVEDWELAEWSKVASPVQRAYAAIATIAPARKSDILQITIADIRDDRLRIVNRKSGKEAYYRLSDALTAAIEAALSIRSKRGIYLFTNREGGCFVSSDRCESFNRSWRKSMKLAAKETKLVNGFTRHDLRAKAGSDAESDHIAMLLLGHSDMATTRKHYRRGVTLIEPAK